MASYIFLCHLPSAVFGTGDNYIVTLLLDMNLQFSILLKRLVFFCYIHLQLRNVPVDLSYILS